MADTPDRELAGALTRRALMRGAAGGLGLAAMSSLLRADGLPRALGGERLPHFSPRAKRVIYLFQSGGPSHIDLYDYKPALYEHHGQELPASVRGEQRITGMTSGQTTFPVVAPMFEWAQHGQCGRWMSELLPHTASVVDHIAFVKTVNTEAINHDPAVTLIQTGTQQLGRPSIGSWLSYGLGSENQDLPAYLVMISQGTGRDDPQPLFSRLWSAGFLPSNHQGVKLYGGREPVLYLRDAPGIDRERRRAMLDRLAELNGKRLQEVGDPEIETRIAQYEMAFRMQASVPDLVDMSDEPDSIFELYGPDSRKPGTYAANCLLARRMAERGVRMIQLFHRGWDQHNDLPTQIRKQAGDTDQASAALIRDLHQRGMLEDTLVVWGGEFGRTVYSQGTLTETNHGRDHHGRCYTVWMAGGGIRGGVEHGETDDFCYNIVRDGVHIRDLNATILHCLGFDHAHLTYKFQGLHQRLTGVEGTARIVDQILT